MDRGGLSGDGDGGGPGKKIQQPFWEVLSVLFRLLGPQATNSAIPCFELEHFGVVEGMRVASVASQRPQENAWYLSTHPPIRPTPPFPPSPSTRPLSRCPHPPLLPRPRMSSPSLTRSRLPRLPPASPLPPHHHHLPLQPPRPRTPTPHLPTPLHRCVHISI